MTRKIRAFTLIELLVVISIIALLIGILLPALGAARRTARQMQNSTQIRGIIQGCILYAQGNGDYYPGITSDGKVANTAISTTSTYQQATASDGSHLDYRLCLLLNGNYFTPEYAISPSETVSAVTKPTSATTTVNVTVCDATGGSTSYAMLNVGTGTTETNDTGRVAEWKSTTNSQAVVITDRAKLASTMGGLTTTSIHVTSTDNATGSACSSWRGSVGWNDNHVDFETTALEPTTKYGTSLNSNDELFTTTVATGSTTSCALMIYK